MSYGRCVTCGAPGKTRERRPNGNTTCENGHTHSSAAFDRHQGAAAVSSALNPKIEKLQEYRDKMECPMEELAHVLGEIGAAKDPLDDSQLVRIASRKLKTLHRLAAAAMLPEMLAAVMAE